MLNHTLPEVLTFVPKDDWNACADVSLRPGLVLRSVRYKKMRHLVLGEVSHPWFESQSVPETVKLAISALLDIRLNLHVFAQGSCTSEPGGQEGCSDA